MDIVSVGVRLSDCLVHHHHHVSSLFSHPIIELIDSICRDSADA